MSLPEMTQNVKTLIAASLQDLHTAIPGRVVRFYPGRCQADIMPYGKYKKPDGGYIDYPMIANVPVIFPQSAGQTATIAFPVRTDDECILIFSEQALDNWKTGSESNIDLQFDLVNAVAIIGLFSKSNPVIREAAGSNTLILDKDGTRITIGNGNVQIIGKTTVNGNVQINGDITVNGNMTISGTLTVGGININNHTHGGVESGAGNTGTPN